MPESNLNSEDESESEDISVAEKGRKYYFGEECVWIWLFKVFQRDEFHELQILQLIPTTCGEHEICR